MGRLVRPAGEGGEGGGVTRAMSERPSFLLEEHLSFLDDLRESGDTNMYGAGPYLQREFPTLTKNQTSAVLFYWMATFGDRHK